MTETEIREMVKEMFGIHDPRHAEGLITFAQAIIAKTREECAAEVADFRAAIPNGWLYASDVIRGMK